jgi:DNA-binding HxlR family transcriptional regulator
MDVEDCARGDDALTRAFDLLGTRWTGLLLGQLGHGSAGFRQLSRTVGKVSDSVLSERLTRLAEAGLIRRMVREGPPVAVVYELTPAGAALIPALVQIAAWAEEHLPEIQPRVEDPTWRLQTTTAPAYDTTTSTPASTRDSTR